MSASSKKKQRKEQNAAAMTERQQREQKEAKSLKAYTITFIVVMVLVVAMVAGIILQAPITGMVDRATIALTVGNHKLSTTQLSYFYVDAINSYYNNVYSYYGSYAQYFLGFTPSDPLGDQVYDKEAGTSWADYFIDQAIENATSMYAMYDLAVADNHELTEEEKTSLETTNANLGIYATAYGYSSTQAYLKAIYGAGTTMDSYEEYCEISALASSYYNAHAEELEDSYTAEMFREYEKDNLKEYSSFSYLYYNIVVKDYIEGEKVKDEDGNEDYTDEQKAAALAAARADADALLNAGITDLESFNKAIQALEINKPEKGEAADSDEEDTDKEADADKEDEEEEVELPECTEAEDVLYANLGALQDWVGHVDRKPGDLDCVEYPTATKDEDEDSEETEEETKEETEETEEDPEITNLYIVLFQEENTNEMKLVNIRHILIEPEISSGKTEATEEQKAAAKKKAEELLAQWKEGDATAESFGELANKNSADSNGSDGGLYEEVFPGQMVEAFNDWCFDAERKAGDTGVVETDYGYHVMYFEDYCDINYRDYMISNAMLTEDMEEWHNGVVEKVTVTKGDLSRMDYDFTFA